MHRLRRFYYNNKTQIWKVILIIALILGLIHFLDKQILEKASTQTNEPTTSKENVFHYQENEDSYIYNESLIPGGIVSQNEADKVNNTIGAFLNYCKKGNAEEAYSFLSEDCKNERYKTVEKFKEQYISKKFGSNQLFEIKKLQFDTYQVDILEDILATGNINNTQKITEYITIIKEGKEEKLNLNGYIGKKTINKESTQNDIKIKVLRKDIYMENEIYYFTIENLSNKTIKLDTLKQNDKLFLKDFYGNKYRAYINEITDEEITIEPKVSASLTIKFAKTYVSNPNITDITFDNLILDYKTYKKDENNPNKDVIYSFKIDL